MKVHWAVVFLCILNIHLVAGADELFIPVDHPQVQKVTDYNGNAIEIPLYFSSQHKIVKINEDLLLEKDRKKTFTLSLFDGKQLTIKPMAVKERSIRRTSWRGEILYPSMGEQIEQLKQKSPKDKHIIESITALNLTVLSWDVDNVSGEAALASTAADISSGTRMGAGLIAGATPETLSTVAPEDQVSKVPDIMRHAFKTVSGSFRSLITHKSYRIASLKYTPRYHIIYEIDPEKDFGEANDNFYETVKIKEQHLLDPGNDRLQRALKAEQINREKAQQYKTFLDSLTEDSPRKIMGDI